MAMGVNEARGNNTLKVFNPARVNLVRANEIFDDPIFFNNHHSIIFEKYFTGENL